MSWVRRHRRLALVAVVVLLAALGTGLVAKQDEVRLTAAPIHTAREGNGLPGLVTVERQGNRRIQIRPEWASWSRRASARGTLIEVWVGRGRAFMFRAWSAPGQPGWVAVPTVRAGAAVAVRSLGSRRDDEIIRPNGWTVTWEDGMSVGRSADVTVRVAQTPAARPWDALARAGDSFRFPSTFDACDTSKLDDCEKMPAAPYRPEGR